MNKAKGNIDSWSRFLVVFAKLFPPVKILNPVYIENSELKNFETNQLYKLFANS